MLPPFKLTELPELSVQLPMMVALAPVRESEPATVTPPSNLRILAFPNLRFPVLLMVVAAVTSSVSTMPGGRSAKKGNVARVS